MPVRVFKLIILWFKTNKVRVAVVLTLLTVSAITFMYFADKAVRTTTQHLLYSDLNKIPVNKVGLVLGTSRFLSGGQPNPYFTYRIRAAKALYFSGKIQYLLLSGDNRFFSYNEPREMRRELIRMGIPDSVIVLDFAGFRTFDSVVRSNKVFKLRRFTIVSQPFHNARAVYIARHFGIDAIAFNAADPPDDFTLKVRLREYMARAKMMLDLYVLRQQPYFLGDERLPEGAYKE